MVFFELRDVGKLNPRVLWFFMKGRRIVLPHGIRNKGWRSRRAISSPRGSACAIGATGPNDEKIQFRPLP
jgi:hypothetical protein